MNRKKGVFGAKNGGHHNQCRSSREKLDESRPIRRCIYCGRNTNNEDGFCRVCHEEGFVGVYKLRGHDNGWRWHEAWAKSHPNPVKHANPNGGFAKWRVEHFYENISAYARKHFCTSKKRTQR